jgi:GDP-L-fucose synthase
LSAGVPDPAFWAGRRVTVTGGAGFLGRATVRLLEELEARVEVVRSSEHDLRDPAGCREALAEAEVVIHLAANVGGIGYNARNPAPLARDNLLMGVGVFDACLANGVGRLVAACSVCAYPKETPVPFREEEIWNGFPEESNAPYGLAKRMLLTLSDSYRRQHQLDSCVPVIANLYGPGDNFDPDDSHVIAAMVRRYVEAAESGLESVAHWGTGTPTREFLYVEDAARALLLAAERLRSSDPVNIGSGRETSIRELAEMIAPLAGFEGETLWDDSMPDGQPRRYLDVSRARELLGFEASTALADGLRETVEWFKADRGVSLRSQA